MPQLQSAARRISREMSRRGFIAGVGASLTSLGLVQPAGARAAPPGPTPPIVFGNFLLFDGKSKALREGVRLLVEGNRITRITTGDVTPPEGARMIDCGGRVMMPGLIDAHWHTIFAAPRSRTIVKPRISVRSAARRSYIQVG
jgi:imidazolonepropionase-like amidohydrolase